MYNYEVFISFKNTDASGNKTKDFEMAQSLYHKLMDNGVVTFFSEESITELGEGNYRKLIDSALDQARILVAVTTSKENITSKWVQYEYLSFHEDILSGIKKEEDTMLCSLVADMNPSDLPRPLRGLQVFEDEDATVRFILNKLGRSAARPVAQVTEPDVSNTLASTNAPAIPANTKNSNPAKPKKENKPKKQKAKKTANTKAKKVEKKFIIAVATIIGVIIAIMATIITVSVVKEKKDRLEIPVIIDGVADVEVISRASSSEGFTDLTFTKASAEAFIAGKESVSALMFANVKFEDDALDLLCDKYDLNSLSVTESTGISNYSALVENVKDSISFVNCGLTDDDVKNFASNTIAYVTLSDNEQLTNIDFVSNFPQLVNINVDNDSISNIELLANCEELRLISANNNNIESVDFIANLTHLDSISFANNKIYSVPKDIKSLELSTIDFSSNELINIDFMKNLGVVTILNVSDNGIHDFSLLANSKDKLTNLDISDNLSFDLSVIPSLTQLESLHVDNMKDFSIDMVSNMKMLNSISASGCNITDISAIPQNGLFTYINLSNNSISDIKPLNGMMKIDSNVTVDLSNNSLTSFVTDNTFNYSYIKLNGNEITDFSSIKATGTVSLYCDYAENITLPNDEISMVYIAGVPDNKKIGLKEKRSGIYYGEFDENGEFIVEEQ